MAIISSVVGGISEASLEIILRPVESVTHVGDDLARLGDMLKDKYGFDHVCISVEYGSSEESTITIEGVTSCDVRRIIYDDNLELRICVDMARCFRDPSHRLKKPPKFVPPPII